MTVVAVGSVIVALAVGGFAWRDHQALKATKLELANTSAQLEKARAAYRSMESAGEGFRKEAAEQKLATDQVHADLNATKAFLEAEKGSSTRLREELMAAKAQIASRTRTRAK